MLAVASLTAISTVATAADVKSVDFQALQVVGTSKGVPLALSLPSATDETVLEWAQKSGKVTELDKATIQLDGGKGAYSTMQPVAIESPDPSLTINGTAGQVGTDVTVQASAFSDDRVLMRASVQLARYTGKQRVMYTTKNGQKVMSKDTTLRSYGPAQFIVTTDKPFVTSMCDDNSCTLFVLTPHI